MQAEVIFSFVNGIPIITKHISGMVFPRRVVSAFLNVSDSPRVFKEDARSLFAVSNEMN